MKLLKLLPDLLNQDQFVQGLSGPAASDRRRGFRAPISMHAAAYLDRLWAFVERLAPAHNSLKLHVLHHRLLARSRTRCV